MNTLFNTDTDLGRSIYTPCCILLFFPHLLHDILYINDKVLDRIILDMNIIDLKVRSSDSPKLAMLNFMFLYVFIFAEDFGLALLICLLLIT